MRLRVIMAATLDRSANLADYLGHESKGATEWDQREELA
jgi:hypothetical protein